MVVIAKYQELLHSLGLATLEQVRQFTGHLIKNHRNHRDIFRIRTHRSDGSELVLFLKRNLKPYRKDGLASLLRRGRVWSVSRQEWENARLLEQAGIRVAPVVAYGERCTLFWETYSYLLTEAAPGQQTVEHFIETCAEAPLRRRVLDALAREIRKMHDAGLATPDLFTRHIFVDCSADTPAFCLIDMARLDRKRSLSPKLRARDLAALHVTSPLRFVSTRERLRFLKVYAGNVDLELLRMLIERRAQHLLQRRKFQTFHQVPGATVPPPA